MSHLKVDTADEDGEVEVMDIISAMAESLVESQSHFHVDTVPDKKQNKMKIGGKPPREVFYRNTNLFSRKLPEAVAPRTCTCRYMCRSARIVSTAGAPAAIKCFSCVIFDPTGLGYFCKPCFDARHPWYRVPHVFSVIENDEDIKYTLKIAHRIAETYRYEKESYAILDNIKEQQQLLNYVSQDEKIDDRIMHAGRKILELEAETRGVRKYLRDEIRHKYDFSDSKNKRLAERGKINLPICDDEAIVVIQRVFQGYKIRKTISKLYLTRIVKVFDHAQGRDFYYDKMTGTSSWVPPRFLKKRDYELVDYQEINRPVKIKSIANSEGCMELATKSSTNLWLCRRSITRRRSKKISTKEEAILVLQNFCRCIKARQKVRTIAKQRYVRVLDADTQTFYYCDTKTGKTSWNKPSILLHPSDEPPIFSDEELKEAATAQRQQDDIAEAQHLLTDVPSSTKNKNNKNEANNGNNNNINKSKGNASTTTTTATATATTSTKSKSKSGASTAGKTVDPRYNRL